MRPLANLHSNWISAITRLMAQIVLVSISLSVHAQHIRLDSTELLLKEIFKESLLREKIRDFPLITQFNRRHFLKVTPIELYFGENADLCELYNQSLHTESLASRYTVSPWPIIRFVKSYYVILRVIDGKYVSRDGVEIPLKQPTIVAVKRMNRHNYYLLRIQKYEGNEDFRVLDSVRCK